MTPKVIYGHRASGRTTKLINLCRMHNNVYGNHTVILAKDHADAFRIKQMADALGYIDMPFPVTFDEIYKHRTTHYEELLIDDMDIFVS